MHPWIENTKRNRDARRELNALPHARGHDPGGQRFGRRLDQNSRSPDRAASSSGLQDIQRGQSMADTWSNRGAQLTRGLKRKAPALAWTVGTNQAKRTAKNTYKRATQRVRDIFGL